MLTMQYCMDLPPDLRANVDYVFILREPVLANRQKLYKNFFGIFPTFDSFSDTMLACTENYECLVLDNTSKSNKIEDVVFWYKAHFPLPKFRIGTKELWLYHKKSCKAGTESKSEIRLDPKKLKKKGNSIIVKKMGKKKKSVRKD